MANTTTHGDSDGVLGFDDWIAQLGGNGIMGLVVALLLGLRHATDPDHLTAVSTLLLSDQRNGTRRAGVLGLSWGLGHAATLFAFGLPVVLFGHFLPRAVQRGAEVTVGLVIVALALRLLLRWRRGYFHSHAHAHGAVRHAHPHVHEGSHAAHARASSHTHRHEEGIGRSPLAAFAIGLVHGAGGSAAVGVLLVSAVSSQSAGVLALIVFAAATAVSMALVSSAFGYALTRGVVSRPLSRMIPVLGVASLLFGSWYAWNGLVL
jgi:ABC-type nickel/cobalt efflux system permease component RcnA